MGLVVGGALSIAVSRVLSGVLYGTAPSGSALVVVTAALLVLPIAVASYLPASRASRIEPMSALRQD